MSWQLPNLRDVASITGYLGGVNNKKLWVADMYVRISASGLNSATLCANNLIIERMSHGSGNCSK